MSTCVSLPHLCNDHNYSVVIFLLNLAKKDDHPYVVHLWQLSPNSVGEPEAENSDIDIEDGDLSPDDEEEPEDSSSDKDSENTDTA